MRIALYPGTLDPITYGHIDVIKKSLNIFDKVVVATTDNINKNYHFTIDDRLNIINDSLFKELKLNKKNSKNYDWIAVVKRNNVAVKKLTNFLGYKNVSKNKSHYEIIKNTFNVSHKKYYYLHLNNNQ